MIIRTGLITHIIRTTLTIHILNTMMHIQLQLWNRPLPPIKHQLIMLLVLLNETPN
jgi:hypothetical protein